MLRIALVVVGLALLVGFDTRQLSVFGLPWPGALAVAAVVGVPVVLIERAPLRAWQVMASALLCSTFVFGGLIGPGYNDVGWPWPVLGMVAFGTVLFAVAARYERALTVTVGALTVLAVPVPAWWLAGLSLSSLGVLAFLVVAVLAWGDSVRVRRAAQLALAEETERHAVLRERARIAREMHDVVAHHVSVIAIQAEAGRLAGGEPRFAAIRSTAAEALTEMRRVLGLLNDAEAGPPPGLESLPALVERTGRAGVDVRLSATDEPVEAPVSVAAYRMVQEALSNAVRHAPGSTVDVEVRRTGGSLTVRVTDTGGDGPAIGGGAGLGLAGMRERVRLLGGTLRAGRLRHGGFEVRAELPLGQDGRS
ncbi:sensor histidine kinase [Amycolatopsis suaedae]|uniref:histidine kinase n=1 Tax=Amycolatopsis suaedae TaxID=2510978 RepID=A0A4V2EL88_9PSEU|nr:histidine kinase [Amycolatopsis suaedae]RZQ60715.1 sensor histidine kinase [Amycolatopsis suaedae]